MSGSQECLSSEAKIHMQAKQKIDISQALKKFYTTLAL